MSVTVSSQDLAVLEITIRRINRDLTAALEHAAVTGSSAEYEAVAHTVMVCETVTQDLRRTLGARGLAASEIGTNEP